MNAAARLPSETRFLDVFIERHLSLKLSHDSTLHHELKSKEFSLVTRGKPCSCGRTSFFVILTFAFFSTFSRLVAKWEKAHPKIAVKAKLRRGGTVTLTAGGVIIIQTARPVKRRCPLACSSKKIALEEFTDWIERGAHWRRLMYSAIACEIKYTKALQRSGRVLDLANNTLLSRSTFLVSLFAQSILENIASAYDRLIYPTFRSLWHGLPSSRARNIVLGAAFSRLTVQDLQRLVWRRFDLEFTPHPTFLRALLTESPALMDETLQQVSRMFASVENWDHFQSPPADESTPLISSFNRLCLEADESFESQPMESVTLMSADCFWLYHIPSTVSWGPWVERSGHSSRLAYQLSTGKMDWLRTETHFNMRHPRFRLINSPMIHRRIRRTYALYVEIQVVSTRYGRCIVSIMSDGVLACRSPALPILQFLPNISDFIRFTPQKVKIVEVLACLWRNASLEFQAATAIRRHFTNLNLFGDPLGHTIFSPLRLERTLRILRVPNSLISKHFSHH